MSGAAVIAAAPFLFGKLPAYGDFIGAGLAPSERAAWDARCTAALAAAAATLGPDVDAVFERVPAMGFALAEEAGWQAGCVAPSCDRAGRSFLFVLGARGDAPWPDGGRAVAARLAPCLHAAIADRLSVEAILARGTAALAGAGEAADLPVMQGWDDGWLAAAAMDANGGKDG
jgi:type VI secretion system ImpM family protein